MRALRMFMTLMAAAGVAGAITVLTVASEEVEAKASGQAGNPTLVSGPTCSQQAWPYYEPHCVRRMQTNPVRIISIDRRTIGSDRN